MAPFDLQGLPFVFANVAVGFGFGFTLERAGFGDARRLAEQFYLRDMTVLKVMFTAIVTAMVLVHWASALGWVDLGDVWINPTYLGSAVLGGLLLGMGFIIGGYCPGTSLVAVATLKLDALMFVLGVLFGIFLFGETVPSFWTFFQESGDLGRYTLDQWMGLTTGQVTVLVVLLALFMFWGAEKTEAIMRSRNANRENER